ncbi:MAG: hypothetical protein QM730_17315 [Anaerolineales bacterium]
MASLKWSIRFMTHRSRQFRSWKRQTPASRPGFRHYARRFFEGLLKLVAWVIILGVIGGGLYFGLPLLYQRYIVPVQENTAALKELRAQQAQSEQIIADLQTRLSAMETEQAQQAESLTAIGGRVTNIEKEIEAHSESLSALDKMQETLQSQDESASAELKRQVNLVKSMELLSRARLFMYQSNFGLAKQDVQSARELLAMIRPDAPEALSADLDAVLLRLDLVLTNLPNFPVSASNDLDVAWQLLLGKVPQPQPTISATPSPELTSTPTAQPTIQPTVTP